MTWVGPTMVHLAIKEAGWPADVLAKALKADVADVTDYLDKGTPLPSHPNEALNAWLSHHIGRGSDGLMYVDPFRPTVTMLPIIAAEIGC